MSLSDFWLKERERKEGRKEGGRKERGEGSDASAGSEPGVKV